MFFGANTFIWKSPFTTLDTDLFDHIQGLGFDAVEIAVESDDGLNAEMYGPDGFRVSEYSPYGDELWTYTAESDGVYLVVVEGYSGADYTLTVSAAE